MKNLGARTIGIGSTTVVVGRPQAPETSAEQHWRPFAPEYLQAMRLHRQLKHRELWVSIGILAALVLLFALTGSIPLALLPALMIAPFWVIFRVAQWDLGTNGSTPGDELLVADLQRPEDILVEIYVEVDGVVLGRDRGVAWFDSTGYCFYGHRSWFRIAQADLLFPDKKRPFAIPNELEPYRRLTIIKVGHQRRKINIGMREIARAEEVWNCYVPPKNVLTQIYQFLGSDPLQNLPTQLPPLRIDPQWRLLRGLHLRPSVYWTGLLGVFLLFLSTVTFPTVVLPLIFGVFACWALWAPGQRTVSVCRARIVRARLRLTGALQGKNP